MSSAGGNRAKRYRNTSPGPWLSWPETDRAERCIRFMETYLRLPKGYGAGQLLRLAPFQKQWIRSILRPGVSSAILSVPRGNGKSTLLAGIAVWALFDPDPESGAAQVPVVATTVSQAIRTVYGPALAMIRAEPELESRCLVYTAIGATRITHAGGELFPVANDPDGLQGLDPSLAVCDEIGFMPQESWDSLLLASVKRPRALVVGIGTPGLDKQNALWHLRSRVLEGAEPPGFTFTEYAAPDGCAVSDEAAWYEANPALAEGYLNLDALRTNLALAPEGHFRIFHLGCWVDGVECWLGDDGRKTWDALRDPYTLDPGAWTYIGVDVALKHDSTAVVVVQRREDGRLHAAARIWQPTKEQPVDVTDVMQHLRQLCAQYDVQGISYDPRFFDVPAKYLSDEGLPMVEVPQSVERMTPAVTTLYELIGRGELSHDGAPEFDAQVLNAVARFNERGFTLSKGKSRGRIDAAVALALATDLALRQPPPAPPVFFAWA